MSLSDDRWSRTATQLAELEERRRPAFTEAVRAFLQPVGTERAIDVGTGTGALAFALAPWVAEVIAVDSSPELLEQARLRAADFPDVTFVEGDGTSLDVLPGRSTSRDARAPSTMCAARSCSSPSSPG